MDTIKTICTDRDIRFVQVCGYSMAIVKFVFVCYCSNMCVDN